MIIRLILLTFIQNIEHTFVDIFYAYVSIPTTQSRGHRRVAYNILFIVIKS